MKEISNQSIIAKSDEKLLLVIDKVSKIESKSDDTNSKESLS